MSEVPLYNKNNMWASRCADACPRGERIQGYLAHKKTHPPRTTIGPQAYAYCRVLGGGVSL